ncbi:hypothetical protein C8R44DRAFT_834353 [Mycena epipterygia]|nr:hypothetical protein C8R44DRAFT_834353 [Mycena epipterygia]
MCTWQMDTRSFSRVCLLFLATSGWPNELWGRAKCSMRAQMVDTTTHFFSRRSACHHLLIGRSIDASERRNGGGGRVKYYPICYPTSCMLCTKQNHFGTTTNCPTARLPHALVSRGHVKSPSWALLVTVEDLELRVCACSPAAVQLMYAGAFPYVPLSPSLAVDLRVLEFAMNLFVQIAPNNTALTITLERVLGNMGFQLEHQTSLRRRFGNCLMWYTHLRTQTKEYYSQIIESTRLQLLDDAEEDRVGVAPNEEQNLPPSPTVATTPAPVETVTPQRVVATSSPPPRGRQANRNRGRRIRSSSSGTPTPVPLHTGHKRVRDPTPEAPQVPFPEPPRRTRPSEYLRRWCPACFGDLKHDPATLADVNVCINACFTQKKKKSPRDPPRKHPQTHFVPEEQAAETGGIPRKFFEDTAIMVNMHSAGEKQFNVVVLMETLFQHLPLDIVWGFLSRFMDRLAFAVSCQLLYHPRKRAGFGFTNGEGCERFWHSISLFDCQLAHQLYTLDAQIEHADEASLFRLGEWIARRHLHSRNKRREAKKVLTDCGKPLAVLREQWALQVATQTKPLTRRGKKRGEQAVNAVMLLRQALKTRIAQVDKQRQIYLDAVEEEDPDAAIFQVQYKAVAEALTKSVEKLRQKKVALGVTENQQLKTLATSQYIRLRMNARVLKRRLRDLLRSRKFELDKLERSFRHRVNDQKLYSHTKSAVKCREPTISKVDTEYNKLCSEIRKLIKDGKAPRGAIAPLPIPSAELWQLDVDDGIWQDVGLDDDDGQPGGAPPLWLADEKVREGIKAMLEVDQCNEEDL